jgi:hypothetical protein
MAVAVTFDLCRVEFLGFYSIYMSALRSSGKTLPVIGPVKIFG